MLHLLHQDHCTDAIKSEKPLDNIYYEQFNEHLYLKVVLMLKFQITVPFQYEWLDDMFREM